MRAAALRRWVLSRVLPAAPGRRIIVHVGPHKTGSTSIQALLRANRRALAPGVEVICQGDPALSPLHAAARAGLRPFGAAREAARYRQAAAHLARACRHLPCVVISNEGLLGPMPTQFDVRGLYLAGGSKLGCLVEGLSVHGAEIEVVFYRRGMEAWTRSLMGHLGETAAEPAAFRAAHGIPNHWAGLLRRLTEGIGQGTRLTVVDFEEDARDGRLGTALLKRAGVAQDQIDALTWPRPRRVRNKGA